jgi:hypothetical protein
MKSLAYGSPLNGKIINKKTAAAIAAAVCIFRSPFTALLHRRRFSRHCRHRSSGRIDRGGCSGIRRRSRRVSHWSCWIGHWHRSGWVWFWFGHGSRCIGRLGCGFGTLGAKGIGHFGHELEAVHFKVQKQARHDQAQKRHDQHDRIDTGSLFDDGITHGKTRVIFVEAFC